MGKLDGCGVEEKPGAENFVFPGGLAAGVKPVGNNGMAEVLEVNPDLVGSAGLRLGLKKGNLLAVPLAIFHHPV